MQTPRITTDVQTITPEIAITMLQDCEYIHQRPTSNKKVLHYANEMSRGAFQVGSEMRVAQVGERRFLVNGKHRLKAVIACGIAQVFVVTTIHYSSDDEVAFDYNTTDRGRIRTVADQYKTLGFEERYGLTATQVNAVGAAISLIYNQFISTQQAEIPYDDRKFLFECFGSSAEYYFRAISGGLSEMRSPLKRSTAVALGLVTFEFAAWTLGEKLVLDYWEGIANDDGLQKGDPRKVAMRHLLNTGLNGGGSLSRSKSQVSAAVSVRYLINTFNRFAQGQSYKEGTGGGSKVYRHTERLPVTIVGTPWRGKEIDVVEMMKLYINEKYWFTSLNWHPVQKNPTTETQS